jgi:hypothetical protein
MSRRHDKFIVVEASRAWLHLVPEGRKEITIVGVFGADGRSTHAVGSYVPDVRDGLIKIEFGVEEHVGYAIYEYEDGLDAPCITVNCGGAAPVGATF